MNKDDLIESFESLTPDHSQKEKMLANVLNSGMEKNVHKVSFNFRYAFSTAAAAVCVLAVVIAVRPMYKYHNLSQTPPRKATPVTAEDKVEEQQSDVTKSVQQGMQIEVVEKETKQTQLPTSESNNKLTIEQDDSSEATNSVAITSGAASVENEVEADSYIAPDAYGKTTQVPELSVEESVKAFAPQLYINMEGATGVNAKSGDGEGTVESLAGGAAFVELEEITIQQYYTYLGVNLADIIDIPIGYSNATRKYGEFNSEYSDQWLFEYEKGSKYINIITTKHTGEVESMINHGYIPSDINGKKAVVLEKGKGYTAYMISNGVAYTITANDISEADFANLLLSIAG